MVRAVIGNNNKGEAVIVQSPTQVAPQIPRPSGLKVGIGIWYQILPRMNQAKRAPRRDAMRAAAQGVGSNRKGLRTLGPGLEMQAGPRARYA